MTKREFATLTFRIVALYALIQSFHLLSPVFGMINLLGAPGSLPSGFNLPVVIFSSSVPFIFLAALGIGLWLLAGRLAYFVTDKDNDRPISCALSAGDLKHVFLFALGVFTLLEGVSGLVSELSSWWIAIHQDSTSTIITPTAAYSGGHSGDSPTRLIPFAGWLFQIFSGIILLIVARRMSRRGDSSAPQEAFDAAS
jgi:hypothetical protein